MDFLDLISNPQPPETLEDAIEDNTDSIEYLLSNMSTIPWAEITLSSFDNGDVKFSNLAFQTSNVFIGDIDYSSTLTPIEALENIKRVEETLGYSLRVYKTTKGLRVFNTKELIPYPTSTYNYINSRTDQLFHSLRCDEKYIKVCNIRRKYAARISPKLNRPEFEICRLIRTGYTITEPEILFVVKLHDSFCLDSSLWCHDWRCYNTSD